MSSLIRTARMAELAPALLGAAALFALMLMTFADVVLRSAFDAPLPAATELTRILMAVVVFSGIPIISAKGNHISVDLLDSFFPRRIRVIRDALICIACGVLLYWPAERVMVLAERARSYGDVTEYLAIPEVYPAMFIGYAVYLTAALMVLRGIALIVAPRALGQE
ncbi:MAG: TRAP-type C4-dicarboxylate transport system permease small subunit [Paracoccaceae bacterium]|jgi:TRAP-type C4-dicarboxylate transport system permease small subunit